MNKKIISLFMIFLVIFGGVSICYAEETQPQDFFTDGFKCEINDDGPRTYTIVGYESTIYTNIIPDVIDGFTITRIGDGAFKNMPQFTGKINLPDTIISIGDDAFAKCTNITSIMLGSDIKKIGKSAFAECSALEDIELNGVEEIGDDAFFKCTSLTPSIIMPKTLKKLGNSVFDTTSVVEIFFQTSKAPTITPSTFDGTSATIRVPKYSEGYTIENYWPENVKEQILKGDLNLDGLVDSADAAIVLNLYKYNNAKTQDIEIGDMDYNGILDSADAAIILNIYKYSL